MDIDFYKKLTLRSKLIVISVGVILLMLIMGTASVVLVSINNRSMQRLLYNNQNAYNLQSAIGQEESAFRAYIYSESDKTRQEYEAAVANTKKALDELPFDYDKIGESRYEITQTIKYSYENYCIARDELINTSREDSLYITKLYEIYSMQGYIKGYCEELTQRVLEDSAKTYDRESGIYIRTPYYIMIIVLFGLGILLWILYTQLWKLFKALGEMAQASRNMQNDIYNQPDVKWDSEDEMGELVSAFNKMKHVTKQNQAMREHLHKEELAKIDLEQRFAAAQFEALKNQLNPHFLFNTLNTIARMAKIEGAPTSEHMTIAVSNLLRYNLRTNDALVPFSQEVKVVKDYMYIQEMRFGDRISYKLNCDIDDATLVPVFLLQPLVENAIIHGLSPKEDGGFISIYAKNKNNKIRIAVMDNGLGMDSKRLKEVRESMSLRIRTSGIGMSNISRRVSGLYEDGSMRIYSRKDKGTLVVVTFSRLRGEE